MATQNNFKSSAIHGIFTNNDYADGTVLAQGTFQRDLYVGNNLYLGTEVDISSVHVDSGANINFKVNGITYTLTPAIMQILITLSSQSLATQTYVNTQIASLVASAPATLDTLNELSIALGNDPNFATTVSNNIAAKVSISGYQEITGQKLLSNTANVYYGNGSHLTGLATTTLPNTLMYTDEPQTVLGINAFTNSGNSYYGYGANLSGVNSLKSSIITSNTSINQIVPLINIQTAASGNYQFNIGMYNNILFNNATGALTVNKYYGDGSTLSNLPSFSNSSNVYYGDGSHLTGLPSTNPSVITTTLGIDQVVPLVNTQTATPGNYQLNIAVNNNNNMRFNNTTGALTCNYYYGDGSNLSGLVAGVVLTSLGLNQVVPLINTQTATAGNYALNIGASYNNNMLFNNTTGALTCTYYYGDGSNLTGVLKTLPTNLMKTDVTQVIAGINTFNNTNNVYYGSGANLTGVITTLPTNLMKTDISQTITGQNTFSSASNVYYGSGANLTGVLKTLPSNILYTDAIQIISALHTFNTVPICSTNCSTSTQLANKAYVDSVIPVLTNYVTLNTTQNITANKTLSGIITFSDNGANSSNIDQALTQFNITNNILNTTIASLVGIIPTGNTSCIVRTDAVTVVAPYGNVSSSTITGTGGWNAFSNNFFVTGTTTYSIAVQVLSLTQVQMVGGTPIGGTFTSFIGTRFALGTYIISGDLGSGVFNISQNALVASSTKDITSLSLITLNRPFTAGGALTSTITVDYTTSTNMQCLNTSSLLLNAISIQPQDTISEVTMYGNLRLQGSLLYNYGTNINTTRTLLQPLSQFYTMNNTTAITITLPTANASITGTTLIFKRYVSAFATTFNQTGSGSSFIPTASLTPVASVIVAATTYQTTFICAGTYWFQML